MNMIQYKKMSERENSYWWHVGRFDILDKQLSLIRKKGNNKLLRILNIGCGTGGTINLLKKHASNLVNIDVSKAAIRFMNTAGHDAMLVGEGILPFKDDEFDCIVAFDVLEHVKDDQAALLEWLRVLKVGGTFLVTVPAYQWLWSGHDVSLHHFRRYTASELRVKAENAGFTTKRASYMIVFSFPLVAGFRLLSNMHSKESTNDTSYVDVPEFVNQIFIRLLRLEADLQKYIKMPFGTSVLGRFIKSK